MARSGPVTTDTSTVVLGLAQIRVGASAANIAKIHRQLTASESIGALAETRFMGNTDWAILESGFPLIEDYSVPIREKAALECAFKQVTPANLALANGLDPATYTLAHSGEIALGGKTAPTYIRMEARYTYPDGTHYMDIIFPRAQVTSNSELNFATEDFSASPLTFESKNASSDVSGGHAVWDDMPLGRIEFT